MFISVPKCSITFNSVNSVKGVIRVNSVNSVNSVNCVNSVNSVNRVSILSAVLPPSVMLFFNRNDNTRCKIGMLTMIYWSNNLICLLMYATVCSFVLSN